MIRLNNIRSKLATSKGFTLLEIIIVIIIIGILASLALPRYIKTVEYARGFEALIELGTLRQSMYRYFVPKQNYTGATLDNLDVENPNGGTGTHFTYVLTVISPTQYTIVATRNALDNTTPITPGSITIQGFYNDVTDGQKTGTGTYSSVR